MGLFDFIRGYFYKSLQTTHRKAERAFVSSPANLRSDNCCTIYDSIPEDVLELLLFVNGAYQNYDYGMITLEPSLINIDLPVGCLVTPAPPLDYFPSYAKLSPDERAVYLDWLHHVDSPIDIGYVFIFYYGLERILLDYDNLYEKALTMILRLRKHHSNSSFLAYSHDAITATCIVRNRIDLFQDYIETDKSLSMAKLTYMAGKSIGLTPQDIIQLASFVGFKNKRYINNYPVQFERTLRTLLRKYYKRDEFPLSPRLIKESPRKDGCLFANYSLRNRSLELPDILQHPKIQQSLHNILVEAHEVIKQIPLKQRL